MLSTVFVKLFIGGVSTLNIARWPYLIVVALTGCATTPAPPVLFSAPSIEVRIPIPISCIDAADIPTIPPTALRPDADLRALAAQVAIDVLALQQYAEKVAALLAQCAAKDLTP